MSDKANLIVNGVLCYISSARCTYTDQTLLSICQSFYKCDKVVEAKKILYGATGEAVSQRRGEGRLRAELTDILDEFRKADENGVVLPTFVADSFASMPPASGFEVLSEHLISLLAEISNLKQQVTSLTESVDGIKDCNVTDIKEDLYDIKTVLFRNNTQSTQPLLYSTVTVSSLSHDNSKKNKETVENSNKKITVARQEQRRGPSGSFCDVTEEQTHAARGSFVHSNPRTTGSGASVSRKEEQWKVQGGNRKKHDIITGKKKSLCNIRATCKTLDIYVGRCEKSVDCNAIIDYVKNDCKINVIECICVSADNSPVKSFKVTVNASDRDSLLQESLWPENICVRKYFKPRNHGRST